MSEKPDMTPVVAVAVDDFGVPARTSRIQPFVEKGAERDPDIYPSIERGGFIIKKGKKYTVPAHMTRDRKKKSGQVVKAMFKKAGS